MDVGIEEEDEGGGEKTLASGAEEGPERPGSGTEDGPEGRVLGEALRTASTRTEEDAAVVVTIAVGVVTFESRRGLCREGRGREG